jgi:MFS family permease
MPVIVAALGYFVDIYDLILFSIVRVPSLQAFGLAGKELINDGVYLLNVQMIGMVIGGFLWGWLGDNKGRLQIMFASILMYSLANIANGMVTSLPAYAVLRFVAGVGLAGELGAGITLVAEVLPARIRGYGTMLVATVGVSGAVFANLVAHYFSWRNAFFIGGVLGLMLLVARLKVSESGMFQHMTENAQLGRGNMFALFADRKRFFRYINSILVGVPIWFIIGILVTFAPEFAAEIHISGPVSAGHAVMYCYFGSIFGDLSSGLISQYLQSRKKVMLLFMMLGLPAVALYFMQGGSTPQFFYFVCALLGFSAGYWAIFVTVAAEQFGTNLRASVATTAPNLVRGMVVPMTMLFQFSSRFFGIELGALAVGGICMTMAFISLSLLEETFHKDLDYYEEFG